MSVQLPVMPVKVARERFRVHGACAGLFRHPCFESLVVCGLCCQQSASGGNFDAKAFREAVKFGIGKTNRLRDVRGFALIVFELIPAETH